MKFLRHSLVFLAALAMAAMAIIQAMPDPDPQPEPIEKKFKYILGFSPI
ncbi:hypothetical protein X975_26194, partial [Stegodyphus mimosarum]